MDSLGSYFCASASGDFEKAAMLHGAGDRVREDLEALIVDGVLRGLRDIENQRAPKVDGGCLRRSL